MRSFKSRDASLSGMSWFEGWRTSTHETESPPRSVVSPVVDFLVLFAVTALVALSLLVVL